MMYVARSTLKRREIPFPELRIPEAAQSSGGLQAPPRAFSNSQFLSYLHQGGTTEKTWIGLIAIMCWLDPTIPSKQPILAVSVGTICRGALRCSSVDNWAPKMIDASRAVSPGKPLPAWQIRGLAYSASIHPRELFIVQPLSLFLHLYQTLIPHNVFSSAGIAHVRQNHMNLHLQSDALLSNLIFACCTDSLGRSLSHTWSKCWRRISSNHQRRDPSP